MAASRLAQSYHSTKSREIEAVRAWARCEEIRRVNTLRKGPKTGHDVLICGHRVLTLRIKGRLRDSIIRLCSWLSPSSIIHVVRADYCSS